MKRDNKGDEFNLSGDFRGAILFIKTHVAWIGVGLIAIAVALIVAAGINNIGPLRTLFPQLTPTAFAPATEGQSLIIVTDLKDNSGGHCSDRELSQRISDNLMAWIENDGLTHSGVIARHLPTEDKKLEDIGNQAEQIGEKYNATLLLWGSFDLAGVTTNLKYVKPGFPNQSKIASSSRSITDKLFFLQIIVPQSLCDVELYPLSTCQALITLGFEEYLAERFAVASSYLNKAINQCRVFATQSAYTCSGDLLLSHIYASEGDYHEAFVRHNLYRLFCLQVEGPPHS